MSPFSLIKSFVFVLIFSALSLSVLAQQSAQINYQGVARKTDGSPVSEQQISLRLSIHDGGASSPVVYSETRSLQTNKFGLFTTVIGAAGAGTQTGSMTAVNWATGNKFLQVELDPEGGNNFQNLGTSQLQSVPYAIYASQAQPGGAATGDLSGSYPNPVVSRIQGSAISSAVPQNGQVLRWDGSSWAPANTASGGGPATVISGTLPLQTATAGSATTISLTQAAAQSDGYLTRTDWLLFSGKPSKEYVDQEIRGAKTYADALAANVVVSDATASSKGKIQLAGDLSGTAESPLIADGRISSAKIADGAVTDAKIANGISASKVGLGNVNNTSDLAKPISTATQTALDTKVSSAALALKADQSALDLKAPLASPTFTGTVSGITKSMIGLADADNTSDLAKPISIAAQTLLDTKASSADLALKADQSALDLKAPIASPTFTGTVSGITKSMVGLTDVDNTSDAEKPISTATQAALDLKGSSADLDLKAPIASPTFTGTVSGITKSMVGLTDVDNTSDAEKPISTATQAALDLKGSSADLDLKAPIASPTFTGTVSGITKSMVGLTDVDNTSDAAKPISTATQAALDLKGSSADLDLKAPIASPAFTGTVSGITKSMVGLTDVDNTSDAAKPISTATQTALDAKASSTALALKADQSAVDLKAPLASPTFTGTVSGITKSMVGLGDVNNTTDLAKPISTATQAALDLKGSSSDLALKAPLASPTFTGTVAGITKTMVGLSAVDNTSDAAKPLSSATISALNDREMLDNKSQSITTDAASYDKYPSVNAIKTYVDAAAPSATTTVSGKITLAGDLAGTAALPVVADGAITNAKIAAAAAIADTKLATISTAGKVANTATTAASANTASAIVARDASGNFAAGTVTANLTGTASVATNISGGSAGTVPYQSAANTTVLLAAGTSGQVLQSNGAAAPSWVTVGGQVREVNDELTATASQTSFTLTQSPSAASKVKMYVNGIRISNSAYSWTGTTLTYTPTNNGGYALTAGDRIQLDYYY